MVRRSLLSLCVLAFAASAASAQDKPTGVQEFSWQATGLFREDRVADLKAVVARKLKNIEVAAVDYDEAVVTFRFDPAVAMVGVGPDKYYDVLDQQLQHASHRTFALKPLRKTPVADLERIEVGIVGHDCKGCDLAAYEAVFMLEGVEKAVASHGAGKVVVWTAPGKVGREKVEGALKEKRVKLVEGTP